MKQHSVSLPIEEKKLTLETGELASQATSSVLARLGDTMVLATVVGGQEREDIDYFPLSVEYVERLYAGGKIKGSRWVKREGRPSDEAILIARLIDRSIRPLFPKDYKKEVQIVVTVLSVDGENEPDILSIIAVSAALSISRIPWNGPIAGARIGLVKEAKNGNKELLVNPGGTELELSDLDLIISQTKEKTVMIEAGALQVFEDIILSAIEKAHDINKSIISVIEELREKVGETKEKFFPNTLVLELSERIKKSYKEELVALAKSRATKESSGGDTDLVDKIFEEEKIRDEKQEIDKKTVGKAVEKVLYSLIKESIISSKKRPDGRGPDEIRPISIKTGVLPRTHGSAIFQRGTTQALTVATLGSPRLEQLIESAEGEESKRYMHHYSMPPYSVGETGRMGSPTRREIGHGALAERSLLAVIPKKETFPYTIRVVSEILSSNGSTSMASVCGSTLALMDAGVPIIKPVSGIAMGLMSRSSQSSSDYVILTDIIGLEDFSGDMDFKVAGTDTGITAIQLDVKIPGLTIKQIAEILEKAKTGRLFILEKMEKAMPTLRPISKFAPKIEVVKIPVEKIGEVIGPGGRMIKSIIAETTASVDVEDDGSVTISGTEKEAVEKAVTWIKGLTREVNVGETFTGTVKRILPFGAFVEFLPGKEGMVHVSQMREDFVKDPKDVVSIGQSVAVRVIEKDEQGRINLSMRQEGSKPRVQEKQHPLSMQFKREQGRSSWNKRKTHY